MNTPTITLAVIEDACRELAKNHCALKELVDALNSELQSITRRKIGAIKRAAEAVTATQTKLLAQVEGAPELFQKPKTMVIHGIKVGYVKGKGSTEWDSSEQLVKRIRKLFPQQADVLIITEETPSAEALKNLPAADLARLGVTITGATDMPVVKVTVDEVDKFVSKLIDESLKQAAA